MKSLYRFLHLEGIIDIDPTLKIDTPRIGRRLPDVLSVEDINAMVEAVDLERPEGPRTAR